MALPVGVWIFIQATLLGGAIALGWFLRYLAADKDGAAATWIEKIGAHNNCKIEYLQQEWTTGRYLYATPNKDKLEVRLLGSFGSVKHKALVDKDDVFEVDRNHCIIGVKAISQVLLDKINQLERDKLMLTTEKDALFVENANLRGRMRHEVAELSEQGKKQVIIPFVAGMKKGGQRQN